MVQLLITNDVHVSVATSAHQGSIIWTYKAFVTVFRVPTLMLFHKPALKITKDRGRHEQTSRHKHKHRRQTWRRTDRHGLSQTNTKPARTGTHRHGQTDGCRKTQKSTNIHGETQKDTNTQAPTHTDRHGKEEQQHKHTCKENAREK